MILLGADMHKSSHTIAAINATTGELLGDKTIAVGDKGFAAVLEWSRHLGDEVAWALEVVYSTPGGVTVLRTVKAFASWGSPGDGPGAFGGVHDVAAGPRSADVAVIENERRRVLRFAVDPEPAPALPRASPAARTPTIRFAATSATIRRGTARIGLRCTERRERCRGTLTLSARRDRRSVRFGRAAYRIAARTTKAVVVRLGPTARRTLRARHALRVHAVARPAGREPTRTATIRLHRPS